MAQKIKVYCECCGKYIDESSKLIKRIKHMQDRAETRSDSFGKLDPDKYTVWAGYDKGYQDGIAAACESILDFIIRFYY